MRTGVALLLATAAFFLLAVTASAAFLVDDCTGLSLAYAQYSNFSPPAAGADPSRFWPVPPDGGSLLMVSSHQPASVVYTIQGAESVEIAIYSRTGTFATQKPDLKYMLGAYSPSALEQPRYRTRFCPEGRAFLHIGSQTMKFFQDNMYRLSFVDAACSHSHDEFIGANAYASADGVHFVPVQLSLKSVTAATESGSIVQYYEQYAADLPAGAKYIKVTLRDFTVIDTAAGPVPQPTIGRLHLAQVRFAGEALLAGEQQPEPAPDGSSGSGSGNSSSEQTTGGGSSTKREPPEKQKEEKSSSSSSSASASAARQSSAAPRAASGSKSPPAASSSTVPEPQSPPPEEEPVQAVAVVQAAPAAAQPKPGWKALMAAVYTLSAAGVVGRLLYKLF